MHIWNTRKISYVGLLTAASVVFVLIGSMLFALTTFPSIKVSFAGVSVKITGFMFGPLIGAITGFLADLISFLYLPTYYHIGYSFTLALNGAIPGIVMWLFSKKKFSINFHFFSTIIVLLVIMSSLSVTVFAMPESVFASEKLFFHNRWAYEGILMIGFVILFILTFIFRIKMEESDFRGMSQIIIFTSILAVTSLTLIPLWDSSAIGLDYSVGLTLRMINAAPLMLFNIIVIYAAWKVMHPLIQKSFSNSYD